MAAAEQKKDGPGTETGLADGEKKKPNILLIFVGVLVFLLVVAVGGFIGYTRLPAVVATHVGVGDGVLLEEQRVTRRMEVKDVINLEPFLVNLADPEGFRFLRVTFQLGMTEKLKAELTPGSMEVAIIRDTIISLLMAKMSEEIMTTEGKEALREEIRHIVNERYPQNRVAEVYIVDFLIQF